MGDRRIVMSLADAKAYIEAHENFDAARGKSADEYAAEWLEGLRSGSPFTGKRFEKPADVPIPLYGLVLSDHPDFAIIEDAFSRAEIGWSVVQVN